MMRLCIFILTICAGLLVGLETGKRTWGFIAWFALLALVASIWEVADKNDG
jgi:uncharacterized membrane protein HdeD (DUF308 family)